MLIAATRKTLLLRFLVEYKWLMNVCGLAKTRLIEYNKGKVKFANLSTIQGVATGSSSARGSSAKILILDEFSFVKQHMS